MNDRSEYVPGWAYAVFAVALAAVVMAGAVGTLSPLTAALLALLAMVLFIGVFLVGAELEERASRDLAWLEGVDGKAIDLDDWDGRHGDYVGAAVAGDPVSRRSVREIARLLALKSWRTQADAITKSLHRHDRKQAKETNHG